MKDKNVLVKSQDVASKPEGIIKPICAKDTKIFSGQPKGWGILKDRPERSVNLADLDYSFRLNAGLHTAVLMHQLFHAKNVCGSLGFAEALLKAQNEGKEIFPPESRGKHEFIMTHTILLDEFSATNVAYFIYGHESKKWLLKFYGYDEGSKYPGFYERHGPNLMHGLLYTNVRLVRFRR